MNSRGLGNGWEDNGKFWSKSNLYKGMTQISVRKVTYIKIKTPGRLLYKEIMQNSGRKVTYIKK
jgi:hypothetical protein